jgi:plasmid stability protein
MPVPSRNARDGTASTKPSLAAAVAGFVEAARFLGGQLFALSYKGCARITKNLALSKSGSLLEQTPRFFCETSLIAKPGLPMSSCETPMATLHVENIPRDLYAALLRRAESNQRSIAAEVRALLKENVPTAREMKARHEFMRKFLLLRAKQTNSSEPFPSTEEMIREDRER